MSKIPKLNFKGSSVYAGSINSNGLLRDVYSPLQNLADEKTKKLGDFTTKNLNFDLEHPVDIILQDSYDGAVNMILNDGKNRPRLVNSRFSVLDQKTFKIPDHSGFKDTNIYDEETFDVDTQLKAIPIKIPKVSFDGLIDNGGKMHCGSYSFFFKFADADGNETEVIAESGIVQCHVGLTNTPSSIRMGLQEENTSKAIKFTISNIDSGFDFVHVYFSKTASGDDLAAATKFSKIIFDYPVDKNGVCEITITGSETIIGISKEQCYVDYADINSVKTQTVNNNVLLFGNVDTPEHNWDEIKRFTWKIIPRYGQLKENAIGSLDSSYNDVSTLSSDIKDHGFCYYNARNVYYRVGYWPDEIYRFGIVYIFSDNSLSPVINLLGVDFSSIDKNDIKEGNNSVSEYESIFFHAEDNVAYEHLFESEDMYFNKQYRANSKGVIKFPNVDVKNILNGILSPKPLYISFDMSLIGYKKAAIGNVEINDEIEPWDAVLKRHNIKGFFFVRQKRIPTILGQGLIIGLTNKQCGALPVIKDDEGFVVLPFLNKNRLLQEIADDLRIPASLQIKTDKDPELLFLNQAMLCPDAEIDEATYNQLFVSNEFALLQDGRYTFNYDSETRTSNILSNSYIGNKENRVIRKSKLTNVPEDTKTLTNGTDYFSNLAGNPDEPYKTVDVLNIFRYSLPQDLTTSTSLLRGKWGPFVGMSKPETDEFEYGEVYNIKLPEYADKDSALDYDFYRAMNSNSLFFAISHRTESVLSMDCFRGDCFISMFTHRMFRNFADPELPTNTTIINPSCWAENYAVRCTAKNEITGHSNLTSGSEGFYIEPNPYVEAAKALDVLAAIYFLTFNIIGGIIAAARATEYHKKADTFNLTLELQYPNGFANEIVQAFEVYVGDQYKGSFVSTSDMDKYREKYGDSAATTLNDSQSDDLKRRKKVNPKEQELSGGFSLKAIFKADDNYELRGLSAINRADVNAVAMGLWITFPVCSNKNLSMRDIDFSNATEETSFSRKRSFYPLAAKDMHNPLRDSNVIDSAAAVSVPSKSYILIPKVPYFKQEYFTRINNSLRDTANSVTNEFKVMLESAYYDYTKTYGSITKLESFGNVVYVIFKHGIGVLNMAQSILAGQDATLYLPEMQVLSDTYGSMWKDSIILTPSGIYGVDSVAKAIWFVSGTQMKIISDMKIEKFLIDYIDMSEFEMTPYIGHINIKSHYNAFKHDVMFTYYNDKLYKMPAGYSTSSGYTVGLDGYIYLNGDFVLENDLPIAAERLLSKYDSKTNKWTSYSELIKDIDYLWVKGTNWSVCWNEDLLQFATFYDWIPLESENIDNIYFSFDKNAVDGVTAPISNKPLAPQFFSLINQSILLGGKYYRSEQSIKLGLKTKKQLIDPMFIGDTYVYNIKDSYTNILSSANRNFEKLIVQFIPDEYKTIQKDTEASLSFYFKTSDPLLFVDVSLYDTLSNKPRTALVTKQIGGIDSDDWQFITIFFKALSNITVQSIEFSLGSRVSSYSLADVRFSLSKESERTYNQGGVLQVNGPVVINPKASKLFYNTRETGTSMLLWKHGQSGVYDNLYPIKPTNWYGKQHEFNFEFVVNENSMILKIFNNLKIISNKTEPYKFEYEVVGEGYEWFEYKRLIYWINDMVKRKKPGFLTLEDGYKTVLSTPYLLLLADYQDCGFPDLFYDRNITSLWKIEKIPFFDIKTVDKKGLPDYDKSYADMDRWSGVNLDYDVIYKNRPNNYRFNTSDPIIVHDELLNEDRIHTESYANDMKKYGRVRGNMEYLEDLWDIEIRPIPIKWAYIKNNELDFVITEARHRDKYIKIKVRYSGKDLAIILAINTMFDYSFA